MVWNSVFVVGCLLCDRNTVTELRLIWLPSVFGHFTVFPPKVCFQFASTEFEKMFFLVND